jgi:Flp pilus assembly protein TadD
MCPRSRRLAIFAAFIFGCSQHQLSADDHVALSRLRAQSGDRQGAEASLREALTKDPRSDAAHAELGMLRMKGGDLKGAIESARAWVTIDPGSALARNNLGYYLLELGDLEASRAELERALKLDPGLEIAKNNLALLASRKPAPPPSSPPPPANAADEALVRGMQYFEHGNLKEAIEMTRESVKLAPGSARAANNLGYYLLQAGDVPGAIAELKRAVALDPTLAIAKNNLAAAERAMRSPSSGPTDRAP